MRGGDPFVNDPHLPRHVIIYEAPLCIPVCMSDFLVAMTGCECGGKVPYYDSNTWINTGVITFSNWKIDQRPRCSKGETQPCSSSWSSCL